MTNQFNIPIIDVDVCQERVRSLLTAAFVCILCTACGTTTEQRAANSANLDAYSQVAPKSLPKKNITSFTDALQCMDNLLARSRTPEIVVSLRESRDGGGEIAGMEDMLMTSLSHMSRNSRSLRIVATDPDSDPYYRLVSEQQFKVPDVFIRMSAPQFDSQVQTHNNSGSLRLPILPMNSRLGIADNASIVSLDMNMGSTKSLQLIPGVFSRNSIMVVSGSNKASLSVGNSSMGGMDDGYNHYDTGSTESYFDDGLGDIDQSYGYDEVDTGYSIAKFTKFGTNFEMNFNYREGRHTAVRTLIELGVIELIGRYTNLPYQNCLKQSNDDEDTVYSSVSTQNSPVSQSRYGNANAALSTIELRPEGSDENLKYNSGDEVRLILTSSEEAYVYCYYQQYNGDIYQIFPTPYHGTNKLAANQSLALPGDRRLKIIANSPGSPEIIQCVAHSPQKVSLIPERLQRRGFEKLAYSSLAGLIQLHRNANDSYAESNMYMIYLRKTRY